MHMKSTHYRLLREMIGSQAKAAKILDVSIASISRRETGANRITVEAGYAMMWAAQAEHATPSPERIRVKKPQLHRRKK